MFKKAKYIYFFKSYNARRAFSAALFKTDLLWLTTSANCCSTSGGAPGPSCCITLISSLAKRVLCAKSVAEVANRWTSCCLAVSPQVTHNNSCSRGICQSCNFSGSCRRKLLQHYILSVKMTTLPLLMLRLHCFSLCGDQLLDITWKYVDRKQMQHIYTSPNI